MPNECGITSSPEEDLGYFCKLYIEIWITFASVRASPRSSMTLPRWHKPSKTLYRNSITPISTIVSDPLAVAAREYYTNILRS